jgi:hypothetical protein
MMLTFVKHLSLISQLIFNYKIILNTELVGGWLRLTDAQLYMIKKKKKM